MRILQEEDGFYPQIYISSFWRNGWHYINKDTPDHFVCTLVNNGGSRFYNKSIVSAEDLILEFKNKFKKTEPKTHNEREEQF